MRSSLTILFSLTLASGGLTQDRGTWHASGTRGAVAAGGQGAVDAGIATLKAGGNAADAAAATILALSVTDSSAFCFGGEVPILVYDAKRGVVEVLVGLGAAPKLATREHFVKRGGIPNEGIEAAAVPGAFDAVLTCLDRYGTKTFAQVVEPTLALLDKGSKGWHSDLARTIRRLIDAEKKANGDRRRGLRLVADYFYRGPIAREIDEWSQTNGGLIRYSDLAKHRTPVEDPVTADYRGHTVCKGGVWTQGPVLLQALQLLEGFDIKGMGQNRAQTVHTAVEAMKLAFADRDTYYADPYFQDVPLTALLSPKYAEARRPLIDPSRASLEQRPGDPVHDKVRLDKPDRRIGVGGPAKDTTTCVVADDQGNVVAATPSGFTGALAGKTGVWLGSRLQSFNNWAGHPNCIEPGKRPRITLTPTIVLKDKKPVYAVSVAGGDGQDQTTLQLLMNVIDFGMAPADAVTAPRFGTNHHLGSFRQKPPELGSLVLAPGHDAGLVKELTARGHKVTMSKGALTAPVLLKLDPATGQKEAAGDPKARRHAGAY
jgi:gamma-glutamyltranspeptidase / glutathione hydrolase